MLTQLRLGGKFEGIAGLVIGRCAECGPRDYKPSFESTLSLGEVLDNFFARLTVPVFYGLTIGHTSDQATLPIGVMASMDADRGELSIEEAALRPA